MKKIRLISIIIMSLFATLLSTVEAADIKVRAFYADNSVFLRWYPSTYDVYMKCINEGFVVERREANSAEGWARVSEVKKADFNTIMGFVQKEPNVEILGIVLYKSQYIDHNLSSNPELTKRDAEKKIAEVEKGNEDYLYGMMLLQSEFSINFAKFAALNYMDDKVRTQQTYEYRVQPINSKLNISSDIAKVSTFHNDKLTGMSQIKVDQEDRRVHFYWNITDALRKDYSGYLLERGTDGKNFKVVTEMPIVHLITGDPKTKDICAYTDTLPDCGKTYYYRICGLSGFGLTGPYSNVVSAKCQDPFEARAIIKKMRSTKNTEVEIDWDIYNPENQKIKNFIVERATSAAKETQNFTAISNKLPGTARSFVDKKPFKTCYYRIITYGEDDQENDGPIDYINVNDTLPPSIPTGLKGTIDSLGIVSLTWNKNPEDDILGYKIFFANDSTDIFLPACDTFLKKTSYSDTLYLGSLTNDIFYRVSAIGGNYAMSDLSPAIKLLKPDTIAPAAAVMDSMAQDTTGKMMLTWYDSPSKDLAKTLLLRRVAPSLTWDTIGSWNGNSTPKQFADTMNFSGELVYYRFITADEHDNTSMSQEYGIKTKYVKPHCAKNFVATAMREQGGIELSWTRCGCDLVGVRIYREDNGKQRLLYTLPPNETGYFDTKVVVGHSYKYMILPISDKMSQLEISETIDF